MTLIFVSFLTPQVEIGKKSIEFNIRYKSAIYTHYISNHVMVRLLCKMAKLRRENNCVAECVTLYDIMYGLGTLVTTIVFCPLKLFKCQLTKLI